MLSADTMSDGEKKVRTNIYLEPSLLDGLDELRKDEPGLPSRSEMIRALIRKALAEKAAKKPN
jgi:metal-responsive CopG/Arc/MetJ family transcriptional regulator